MVKDILVHKDTLSCEAIMRVAQNGEYIVVCQCGGNCEPSPENRVYLFRSKDGGESWDEGTDIYPSEKAIYQTEVSVYQDKIDIFITAHNGGFMEWENFILRSTDSGYTFKRVELPCDFGFVFIRGRIVTESGRIIYPYHNYNIPEDICQRLIEEKQPIWQCGLDYVDVGVMVSDDNGTTFQRIDVAKIKPESNWLNNWEWSEPTVVESERRHLIMLLRRDKKNFLYRCDSYDDGNTWSNIEMTDIPNPSNKSKLIKNNIDGSIVLLHTPNPESNTGARSPLEVWVSFDGLKTWQKKITISTVAGQHAYPDGVISEDGKKVRFAYEFNRKDIHFVECDL